MAGDKNAHADFLPASARAPKGRQAVEPLAAAGLLHENALLCWKKNRFA